MVHFTPILPHPKPLAPYAGKDAYKALILVIEPDANLRSLLECSIQAGHYLSIGAADIAEAHSILCEAKIDLVLLSLTISTTDHLLPVTDLRRHWSGPTILLSNSRAPFIRNQALNTTATAFLVKPVRLLELHQKIGSLLATHAQL